MINFALEQYPMFIGKISVFKEAENTGIVCVAEKSFTVEERSIGELIRKCLHRR